MLNICHYNYLCEFYFSYLSRYEAILNCVLNVQDHPQIYFENLGVINNKFNVNLFVSYFIDNKYLAIYMVIMLLK